MQRHHHPKTVEQLREKQLKQTRKQPVRRNLRGLFSYDPNPNMFLPAEVLTPPESGKKATDTKLEYCSEQDGFLVMKGKY